MRTPESCPNCGVDVPPRAKSCPGCGSDETTGWSEESHVGGLDLPDEEFNYDEFVKREFGPAPVKPRGIRWLWWIVAVALIVVFFSWLWRR